MIYTQGKGITVSGQELKSLLVFSGPEDVADFIVTGGRLVARAGCPNTVFHVVDGWNGKEKVTDELAWQIDVPALNRLSKIAGKDEDIFFPVSKSGHISRCRIQTVSGDETKILHDSSLDGHVQHQKLIPIDPLPVKPVDGGASMLQLGPAALAKLEKVAKAVGGGIAQVFVPNHPEGRTYIEIDKTERMRRGEDARWIVELAYEPIGIEVGPADPAEGKQEGLPFDDAEDEG